jgi:hypothetical protein
MTCKNGERPYNINVYNFVFLIMKIKLLPNIKKNKDQKDF